MNLEVEDVVVCPGQYEIETRAVWFVIMLNQNFPFRRVTTSSPHIVGAEAALVHPRILNVGQWILYEKTTPCGPEDQMSSDNVNEEPPLRMMFYDLSCQAFLL